MELDEVVDLAGDGGVIGASALMAMFSDPHVEEASIGATLVEPGSPRD